METAGRVLRPRAQRSRLTKLLLLLTSQSPESRQDEDRDAAARAEQGGTSWARSEEGEDRWMGEGRKTGARRTRRTVQGDSWMEGRGRRKMESWSGRETAVGRMGLGKDPAGSSPRTIRDQSERWSRRKPPMRLPERASVEARRDIALDLRLPFLPTLALVSSLRGRLPLRRPLRRSHTPPAPSRCFVLLLPPPLLPPSASSRFPWSCP